MNRWNLSKTFSAFLSFWLAVPSLWATEKSAEDTFQFFEQESRIVTASHLPQKKSMAPATVYVITNSQIRDSGARNIWEALRGVPGLDVIQVNTSVAEINARGLNHTFNNRLLVLLDGRTMLGLYDNINWQNIPVTLEEIDRIEVVEGPASALFGANAVNGVINIITKTPAQLAGGRLEYGMGERRAYEGSVLYGRQQGAFGFKVGAGAQTDNQFSDDSLRAAETKKIHSLVKYDFSEQADVSLSGGYIQRRTQTDIQVPAEDGPSGFLRMDARYGQTRLRTFWNNERALLRDSQFVDGLYEDIYDVNLEHTLALPWDNNLTVGGSYRRDIAYSYVFQADAQKENLWSGFFEDQWNPLDRWTLVAAGRWDQHPFTGGNLSPRGSLLYQPSEKHVFRFSAGTAFRNPTITENGLNNLLYSTLSNPGNNGIPNPPFQSIQAFVTGNKNLLPEKTITYELAHNGYFGRLKTTAVGFYYELRNAIDNSPTQVTSMTPPNLQTLTSFINHDNVIAALGGELGGEVVLFQWMSAYANYSYQNIRNSEPFTAKTGSPRHKVNGGLTFKDRGLTADLSAHWVDQTAWTFLNSNRAADQVVLSDYLIIDAQLSYAFSGLCKGLRIGVHASNLADHETLEAPSIDGDGIIRRQVTGTVSYDF